MQLASWSAFWDMGGYGLYVWGSYGALFFLILAETFFLVRGRKRTLQRIRRMKNWEQQ